MNKDRDARRVREILSEAKALAAEYYGLIGKPLGVTGEVAKFVAAEMLRLKLAPARTEGYDAIRRTSVGEDRIQIKGHAYGKSAKPGQWLAAILETSSHRTDSIYDCCMRANGTRACLTRRASRCELIRTKSRSYEIASRRSFRALRNPGGYRSVVFSSLARI